MTEPAIGISKPAKVVEKTIVPKIPRLNERVFIGRYAYPSSGDFGEHCETIRKCGLVAEVEKEPGKSLALYAARRRARKS